MDKEAEMTEESAVSVTMMQAASALAETLLRSEPFLHFQDAERTLHEDQDAMQLLNELSELQQKIREQQYSGMVSESDLERLRELQIAIGTNDTIQEHGLVQELAVLFLREVNQEISNLLGIDFSSLTRRSCGCC